MSEIDRGQALQFIADLAGPIGPWVFAGFGSEIQKQIAEDPFCTERLIEEWLAQFSPAEVAPILVDIACAQELPREFNLLRERFESAWEHVITKLLHEVSKSDEAEFTALLVELEQHETSRKIAGDLKLWREEEA